MIEILFSWGAWVAILSIVTSLGVIFFCILWLAVELLTTGRIEWDD
jgi:hypothetical protein